MIHSWATDKNDKTVMPRWGKVGKQKIKDTGPLNRKRMETCDEEFVAAAKDFLRWVHKKENYGKWFTTQEGYSVGSTKVWENDPMWGKLDQPLKMFRTAARNTRLFGYAGPSTAKATEAFTKYIITDMYAKGVQGTSAEDAVKNAEAELKKIYES